jgi:hypothetical protein
MRNHYHVVIHTPERNLVEGMKWLQNAYTRFNIRHGIWGRLFGDRHKAVVVEAERSFGGKGGERSDYRAVLIDYVHLNPARANLIRPAEKQSLMDYPWSSVALAYAVAPSKRKPWMKVATGFALAHCPDTVAGRRRYVGRLDEWVLDEQSESAGAIMGLIEGQTLHSTLRRG